MGRRIKGLAAVGALALTAPVVLSGAAADAGTTSTAAASCSRLASAKNVAAVTYADRLIRAWGRGDTATANCYASATTSKTLFGQASPGGIHWRRTATEGTAGTIYVTYHDDARGGNLVVGVQNVGLRSADGWHAAYTARFSGEPKAWNAVQWSDNLVRAWGRGDTRWMNYYASPAVVKGLTRISAKGGAHWQRTASEGAAGTIYVTYRNTVTKHTLVLGISNVGLSQGDAQLAYRLQYR
ncbi:hypothetical protein AB0E69_34330 [Kribbella sp. NPDC026611]|uniref:hypothetical protein n=1 Tax=Kribbella sp. NPDC026611 TaxID=3154911 RepID=UPI0033F7AA6D